MSGRMAVSVQDAPIRLSHATMCSSQDRMMCFRKDDCAFAATNSGRGYGGGACWSGSCTIGVLMQLADQRPTGLKYIRGELCALLGFELGYL